MESQIVNVVAAIVLVLVFVAIPFSVLSLSKEKKDELAKKSLWARSAIYFSAPFILFLEIIGSMVTSIFFLFIK